MQHDLPVVVKRANGKGNEPLTLIQWTDLSDLVIPDLTAQLVVASQVVIAYCF